MGRTRERGWAAEGAVAPVCLAVILALLMVTSAFVLHRSCAGAARLSDRLVLGRRARLLARSAITAACCAMDRRLNMPDRHGWYAAVRGGAVGHAEAFEPACVEALREDGASVGEVEVAFVAADGAGWGGGLLRFTATASIRSRRGPAVEETVVEERRFGPSAKAFAPAGRLLVDARPFAGRWRRR